MTTDERARLAEAKRRFNAARLSLQRAGKDSSVLAGLALPSTGEVADSLLVPLGLSRPSSEQQGG